MKNLAILSAVVALALGLATGDALAAERLSVYMAKFVCGDGGLSGSPTGGGNGHTCTSTAPVFTAGAVTNASYRTAINIENPNNGAVNITKEVVLTELRGVCGVPDITGQTPQAPLSTVETEQLLRRNAVEWDCDQLGALLANTNDNCPSTHETSFVACPSPHNFAVGGFAKGFLIVVSDAEGITGNAPLDLVAVYTSQGKDGDKPTSVDVEEVKGRTLNDSANHIASSHHEDGE